MREETKVNTTELDVSQSEQVEEVDVAEIEFREDHWITICSTDF